MFWRTDLVPVGYCKCSVEGICPIMLLRFNTTQILCPWCTVAEFFIRAAQIPEYLSAPGPSSVKGAGAKVYSARCTGPKRIFGN